MNFPTVFSRKEVSAGEGGMRGLGARMCSDFSWQFPTIFSRKEDSVGGGGVSGRAWKPEGKSPAALHEKNPLPLYILVCDIFSRIMTALTLFIGLVSYEEYTPCDGSDVLRSTSD